MTAKELADEAWQARAILYDILAISSVDDVEKHLLSIAAKLTVFGDHGDVAVHLIGYITNGKLTRSILKEAGII